MMLAASLAGIGFGSAGVHIPHACAYPIASLKHEYQPPGYPDDHAFVPHGWSVIVTAPAAFRFTYEADPEKHRRAAELIAGRELPDADENTLPQVLTDLMRDVGAPSGVRELGYTDDDVDALVEGAIKQQRLLVVVAARALRGGPRGRSSARRWRTGPSRRRSRPDHERANAEHRLVAVEARDRPPHALEAPLAAVVGEARDVAVAHEDQQVAGAEREVALSSRVPSAREICAAGGGLLGEQQLVPLEVRRRRRGRRPRRAARPSRSRA